MKLSLYLTRLFTGGFTLHQSIKKQHQSSVIMMLSVFLGLRLKAVIRLCVLTLHCAECEHVNGLLPSVSPEAHVPLQLNRV